MRLLARSNLNPIGRRRRGWSNVLPLTLLLLGLCRSSFAQALGTLNGTVTDATGAAVGSAKVVLSRGKSAGSANPATSSTTVTADGDGLFTIPGLAPGDFTLTVSASGFGPRTVPGTLRAGETLELPPIILSVASQDSNVQVSDSLLDLAEAEVKVEESQRLIGFYPNFFVSYDWHAPPLSTRQKFQLSFKASFDPATIGIDGAIAGIEQGLNSLSGYGQGAQGYGKRFGAALGDSTVGTLLGGAVFPMLFHQDPRYFYKGSGTVKQRLIYVVAAAVICRGDNGKPQPNYSSILGDLAAGAVSNAYYPASDRSGITVTLENGLLAGTIGEMVNNLLQEFVFRKLTRHVPQYPPAPSDAVIP